MASKLAFTEEEMTVDENLGYPKAYPHLCRSPGILTPSIEGPPSTFLPYILQPHEASRVKDLNQMFPVINPEVKITMNPGGYVNLLWKQLDHLGNAGFDPAIFRVDPFGNVLYLHADSASPLSWNIDHWFPCSRGGRTVPSNLRLLQWQVCRKKQNKLDFLIPWWDLQLGISVNQFLSIFASRNSDFRNRAFCFLFSNGGSEELSPMQTVESHTFPQHFITMKRQVGLASAAIVSSQRTTDSAVLKTLDFNRSLRQNSPKHAARKFSVREDDVSNMALQIFRPITSKENEEPNKDEFSSINPHLSITMARDSLKQREEIKKKQAEIKRMEDELGELKQKNEEERAVLQGLEEVLIKKRRRVEKCRRLAEAQSSYRALLEKMIRDAMHQSVVYKEQLRLNQVATNSLMARLEAQRTMADSSESELRRKYKQRDEIEKQIRPSWEQARKRSRMDDMLFEERHDESIQLWTRMAHRPQKKELRELLKEAQKASEAEVSLGDDEEGEKGKEAVETICKEKSLAIREGSCSKTHESPILRSLQEEGEKKCRTLVAAKVEISVKESHEEEYRRPIDSKDKLSTNDKLEKLSIWACKTTNDPLKSRLPHGPQGGSGGGDDDDGEEYRKQVGKGNIENWLQILLENAGEGSSKESPPMNPNREENRAEETHHEPNEWENKARNCSEKGKEIAGVESSSKGVESRKSFELKERKGKEVAKSESGRGFRSLPSSPSVIFGMRRGKVDCMGTKPKVMGEEDDAREDSLLTNKFIKAWASAIKKAVNK